MKYKNKLFRKGRLMLAANEKGIYKTANRSNQDENAQAFSASPISGQPDHADSRRFDYDKSFDDNGTCESVEWRNDIGFHNKGNFGD